MSTPKDLYTDRAIDFIQDYKDNADPATPFFIYYAMQTPHTPIQAPPETDYPECNHITDDQRRTFCEMVQFADALIGDIVAELKNQELFENTILIFLSDNGGNTGMPRGQNLPLRGKKGSKFEGGVRTASFMYGGYIDTLLGALDGDDGTESTDCDYDGIFYVNDWFPTLLQIASNNQLTNDQITSMVADVDDTEIDGIGLWFNILSECGYYDDSDDEEHFDADTVREWVFSAKMCGENGDDDQYYIKGYVRWNDWKLIINNTQSDCYSSGVAIGVATEFYPAWDGTLNRIPPQDIYEEYKSSGSNVFYSSCYEALSNEEKNDTSTFTYSDLMLFNVRDDPIEACNVVDDYPDVVDTMLDAMDDKMKGNYDGSWVGVPVAPAVLNGFLNWDCDRDEIYYKSWRDEECCNDPTFDDWNSLWQQANQVKLACPRRDT